MKPQPIERAVPQEVRLAAAALIDKQGDNVRVMDLSEVSDFTDYFVICAGTNRRQVQALTDEVVDRLRVASTKPLAIEGYDHAAWVLVDFGHFLVHVFDAEARDYYRLEGMWGDAPDVTSATLSVAS